MMRKQDLKIAIVGATGAVGQELLRVLDRRKFPFGEIRAFGSKRSAGQSVVLNNGRKIAVELLDHEEHQAQAENPFADCDLAFFSAGSDVSKQFAPLAVEAGAVVIDNSSAFRMDPEVPLVVPEINAGDARQHHGILAVPNCTTIILLMGLFPLHQAFGLKRFIASSYQAVSGAGTSGMEELLQQSKAVIQQEADVTPVVFPHPIAFNVIAHIDEFLKDGYTKEEKKVALESKKILHLPDLKASATCVRVPVLRSHSVAVHAEFEKPVSLSEAEKALKQAQGLEWNAENHTYPTPLMRSGLEDCQIGRLRFDEAFDNGLAFWIVGDQLLKGAALNAVQIAELLLE